MVYCLSLLVAHSAPSFLSFRPIPVLSLRVPTSESCHHFSFSCTLSPREFPLSYSLLYLDSLILSLLSYLSVSLFLSLSSTFIHLPLALNLSTSSLAYPFLCVFSLQNSVSILYSSFPSISSSNFAALFPAFTLILVLLHTSLIM
jgi:hypothetical protein